MLVPFQLKLVVTKGSGNRIRRMILVYFKGAVTWYTRQPGFWHSSSNRAHFRSRLVFGQ